METIQTQVDDKCYKDEIKGTLRNFKYYGGKGESEMKYKQINKPLGP